MKILSLITHPDVVPNPQDLRSSSEHKLRYFWWYLRALWPSHRQQGSLHDQGPEKYQDDRQSSPCDISLSTNFTKPQGYFLRKENKNNNFIPHFHLYCFSCGRAFTTVHDASAWWRKPWSRSSVMTLNTCLVFNVITLDLDLENYFSLFLFSLRKKYSRSFVKLQWTDWCHMDYFVDHLGTFLNLCSEDERRSYGFGTTSGWVINDRIFFFWVNYPFKEANRHRKCS